MIMLIEFPRICKARCATPTLFLALSLQRGMLDAGAAATGLTQALVSALLMNVSIVGINQLFDVEIDKVCVPLAGRRLGACKACMLCTPHVHRTINFP